VCASAVGHRAWGATEGMGVRAFRADTHAHARGVSSLIHHVSKATCVRMYERNDGRAAATTRLNHELTCEGDA
jgi:hypothetical protein